VRRDREKSQEGVLAEGEGGNLSTLALSPPGSGAGGSTSPKPKDHSRLHLAPQLGNRRTSAEIIIFLKRPRRSLGCNPRGLAGAERVPTAARVEREEWPATHYPTPPCLVRGQRGRAPPHLQGDKP
jgi:hypothetical protein